MVEEWLDSKPHTLWADWDISRPDRRTLAAEWFTRQVREFDNFRRERLAS